METFSFSPPLILLEEGKELLPVIFFETTNSVFNITDENKSFSVTAPGHWNSESTEKTIDEVNKSNDLSSENDIDFHVMRVRKKE